MVVAAVDVGYGFTKVATDRARCSLPSAVAPAGDGALAGLLGEGAPPHRLMVRRPGRPVERLLVGEAALAAGGRRSWEGRAAERDGYAGLVLAALALAEIRGGVDLRLGLPLGLYLQAGQRTALREAIGALAAEVAVGDAPPAWISVQHVRVLPQGAGALAAALVAQPDLATGPLGLIDVGYRTADVLLMRPASTGLVPDESGCASLDRGCGRIYEGVRLAVGEAAGVLVPEGAVEDALAHQNGTLTVRGRRHALAPLVEAQTRALAADLAAQIRRLWSDRLDFLGALVLAGGGGALLLPHLGALHPEVRLAPDPLYANAAGWLAM